MKPIRLALVLAALFLMSAPCAWSAGNAYREVSGLQWLQMSPQEREQTLTRSIRELRRQKVRLKGSATEYYTRLCDVLRRDPNLYEAGLTTLLGDNAYANEPELRNAIDRMRAGGKA